MKWLLIIAIAATNSPVPEEYAAIQWEWRTRFSTYDKCLSAAQRVMKSAGESAKDRVTAVCVPRIGGEIWETIGNS